MLAAICCQTGKRGRSRQESHVRQNQSQSGESSGRGQGRSGGRPKQRGDSSCIDIYNVVL